MSDNINIRSLAVDILLEVTREGKFSHLVIRDVLEKYRYLPRKERAFLKRLSEGTIERMIELDDVINQFSKTKVNKMKPVIRAIMRISVYQLLYMDSVPDSAVCNEAVKLAAKRGFGGLKGFVNGVLRNIARNRDQIERPDRTADPVHALSVQYSMPDWITQRFVNQYGIDRTEHILAAFLQKNDTCVRVDVNRISPEEMIAGLRADGIRVRPDDRLPHALHISGYDTLEELEAFEDGLLYVQDLSSMMVAEYADVKENQFVLDVCAAPGGKCVHFAQMMHGTGMVQARDLTEYKVELIEQNIERCRIHNMQAVCHDALEYDASMEARADVVIADLPCSGLGVIGTKTDIKYNASLEHIRELADLQRRILDVVYRYVKPGGTLMYSTCTMTPEENQENVRWFLDHHAGFVLEKEKQFLPDEGCDGFYIAKMCRI